MSLNPTQNKLSAEERKRNREKYMIKDKENETIYRHYGDLNGADFKLRNNKNCEIYILDWSKGMYIDDCENCKIFCGPIDGSVFIRGSKNCQFSIIARQVRFRTCENLKVFTYCPTDPAVESSFNIFFAPFNAFFPHLKELFIKGSFKSGEKNHIDTPYDFTPGEELGGGAPHYLALPEEEFFIKVINDGNDQVEEMFEGYSKQEPLIIQKASELPSFEKRENANEDFNFVSENENKPLSDIITSDNKNEPKLNNNGNNFMSIGDFISPNNNLSNQNNNSPDFNTNSNNNNNNFMDMNDFLGGNNNTNSNNNNNNIMDMNDFLGGNSNTNSKNNNNNFMDMNDFLGGNNNTNNSSQQKQNLDFNNFDNFNLNSQNTGTFNIPKNNSNDFFSDNSNKNSMNSFIPNISNQENEELKRQELRDKERLFRQEKIKEKMEKESKMRMEIMAKASQYINQFYEERKIRIAQNREKLMKNSGKQSSSSGSPWGMVESSFTGSSSNADRMKEAILNRNKDNQNI